MASCNGHLLINWGMLGCKGLGTAISSGLQDWRGILLLLGGPATGAMAFVMTREIHKVIRPAVLESVGNVGNYGLGVCGAWEYEQEVEAEQSSLKCLWRAAWELLIQGLLFTMRPQSATCYLFYCLTTLFILQENAFVSNELKKFKYLYKKN